MGDGNSKGPSSGGVRDTGRSARGLGANDYICGVSALVVMAKQTSKRTDVSKNGHRHLSGLFKLYLDHEMAPGRSYTEVSSVCSGMFPGSWMRPR